MDLGMSHQMHQSWQRDTGADHIGTEGMAETVGVGLRNLAAEAMMAE
jgi:hypothetical protein